MDEDLLCRLCHKILQNPKTLPCFHTFCLVCLEQYYKIKDVHGDDGSLLCSICQKEASVALGIADLDCIPSILDRLKKNASKLPYLVTKICQICETSSAEKICKDCNQNMCESCRLKHDGMAKFHGHDISELACTEYTEDEDELPLCELCDLSPPSSKYCNECQSFICDECIEKHNKISSLKIHAISNIKDSNVPVACGMCNVELSTMHCQECPINLCITCTKLHGKFAGCGTHHVKKIEQKIAKVRKQLLCKDHPKKSLKAYCEPCRHLVCDNCVSSSHEGHEIAKEDVEQRNKIDKKQEERDSCGAQQPIDATKQKSIRSSLKLNRASMTDHDVLENNKQTLVDEQPSVDSSTEIEILLQDYDKYLIVRSSLGRCATFGQLYNLKNDEFLEQSVFTENPSVKIITEGSNCKQLIKIDPQSPQEGFVALELGMDEKLNVLLGLAKLEGHAAFLKHSISSSYAKKAGLLLRIKGKEEQLLSYPGSILSKAIIDEILRERTATHFVVGIKWGAKAALIAEDINSTDKDKSMNMKECAFSSAFIEAIQSDTYDFRQTNDKLKNCKVELFSDRLPKAYESINSDEEVVEIFQTMEKIVSSTKDSKGWPDKYLLLPLRLLNDKMYERCSASALGPHISDEITEMAVVYLEKMNDACRSLDQLFAVVKQNEICIKSDILEKIIQFKEKATLVRENVTQKLVTAVSNLESCSDSKIEQIVTESRDGPISAVQIKKFISDVFPEIKRKIEIKRELDQHGIIYVGKDQKVSDIRTLHGIKTYIALFFDPHQKDCDSCKSHFIDLAKCGFPLQKSEHKGHFLAVDLQTSLLSADEKDVPSSNCICVYANGSYQQSIVSQDIEQDKRLNWVYCENLSKFDKNKKPMDRIVVEIPCPCSLGQRERKAVRWLCRGCGNNIQSDINRKIFFCDCGWGETHLYTFHCNSAEHGKNPIPYLQSALESHLGSLSPVRTINILILGATGVGKSTWINGVVNYITYETLKEAKKAEKLITLVPSTFSLTDASMKLKWIKVGTKHGAPENEVESKKGESATQGPMTYCFQYEDVNVKLIDTPGIGDVRGTDQDQINFDLILRHLRNFDSLQGICILLKPNDARLNVVFRFCISELLAHLHRDAAKNIVFCFTNARSTFYLPGDTLPPLQAMLKKYKKEQGVVINTTPETMYCMDNEPFRFLCAMKEKEFSDDELENYAKSWDKSRHETRRLFSYIRGLKSHSMSETLSLNDARDTILALMQPMAEISKTIDTNLKVMEDRKMEISQIDENDSNLREKLYLEKIEIVPVELDLPMTVCTASGCTESVRVGATQVTQTIYKSQCHRPCHLTGVAPERYPNTDLQKCAALRQTGNCINCGCKWDVHIHVQYSLDQKIVQEVDKKVQKMIDEGASNRDLQKIAIQRAEDVMKKLNKDRKRLLEISAKFGSFLKKNAIVPYNDAFDEYILFRIREEKGRVASGGSDGNLISLQNLKDIYAEQVKVLQSAMSNDDSTLTPADIHSLREELFQMKDGETMKIVANIIARSKEKSSTAKQVSFSPSNSRRHRKSTIYKTGLISKSFSFIAKFIKDTSV